MKGRLIFLNSLLVLFCASRSTLAAPPVPNQDAPVAVSLIADVDQVEPGIPFRVGVHFKIPAPWHIYWKNPGDSGLPTRISITAPEGTYIHPLTWPLPVSFTQPGDIVGYGYSKDTLFFTEVSPPADLKSKEFEVVANIKWLNCSTVCIPGKAEKRITLPVGDRKASAKRRLFDNVVIPKPAADLASIFKISSGTSTPELAQFTVQWPEKSQALSVFAYADGVQVGRPTITQQGKSSLISIPLKGLSKKTDLEAVFATETGGVSYGAVLSVPLNPSAQGEKS